ncbi:hypothetical protein [uncultured Imperialibacter sp.]|uniref:hypothetical protein n=1 Tax=uncultured Imperialibacter sp. TaxID=1672639 RepID=UPI0030DD1E86
MRIGLTVSMALLLVFPSWAKQTTPNWLFSKLNLQADSVKTSLIASKKHPLNDNVIWCFPLITEYDCDRECWVADLFVVIATADEEIVTYSRFESALISDAVYPFDIWIDTAPFNVSVSHRAFGIRIELTTNSRAASYSGEEFLLMLERQDSIDQLFRIDSKTAVAYGGGECQETEVHKRESLFIIDKENVVNSHFSIIENLKYQHFFLTEDCEEGNKDTEQFKNVFVFEGGKYQAVGQRQTGW